jgi:hypothetical protein
MRRVVARYRPAWDMTLMAGSTNCSQRAWTLMRVRVARLFRSENCGWPAAIEGLTDGREVSLLGRKSWPCDDLREVPVSEQSVAEVVVVGVGLAGLSASRSFLDSSVDVRVLEARGGGIAGLKAPAAAAQAGAR